MTIKDNALQAADSSGRMLGGSALGIAGEGGGVAMGFFGKLLEGLGEAIAMGGDDKMPIFGQIGGMVAEAGQGLRSASEGMREFGQAQFENVSVAASDLGASFTPSSTPSIQGQSKQLSPSQEIALEKTVGTPIQESQDMGSNISQQNSQFDGMLSGVKLSSNVGVDTQSFSGADIGDLSVTTANINAAGIQASAGRGL
jgi:hypothetical protein